MIQKYGVRKVISSMMILFGILGASQAAATDLNTIVAIRLFLGAAEAGRYYALPSSCVSFEPHSSHYLTHTHYLASVLRYS